MAAEQADVSFEPGAAVTRGILFLVMALLCRYGAETEEAQNQKIEQEQTASYGGI